jgi:hypothetical protein
MNLDLHNVKHADVPKAVHEHIIKLSQMNAHFTTYIITGNSTEMQRIVKNELRTYEWVNFMDELKPGKIFVCGC